MKDLYIKNGLVFSGENEPAIKQNILVEKGVITKMSNEELELSADIKVIDADGKWVMPGFVDNHTHYDGEVLVAPSLQESIKHGVTTVMLGGCSLSFICADVEDCCDMFTRVEAFPREILYPILKEEKKWSTPKEWVNHLHSLPVGPNIASFLGHSDIRAAVMGIDRSLDENEKPTQDEIDEMAGLLQDALDCGFVGISMQHNPWDKMDGRHWSKLLPAAYAKGKERNALTKVVRERGAHLQGVPNLVNRIGVFWYMFQSASFFWRKKLKTSVVALMDLKGDKMIRPIVSGLCKMVNNLFGASFKMQGFPVPFRVYAEGMELVVFEEFPAGELARHLSRDLKKRNTTLNDPEYRKIFKKNYRSKLTPKVWQKDFGDAYVIDAPDKSLIGKSFLAIAEERKQHPVDTFLDLVVEMDKEILWETTIGNHDPDRYKPHYNDPNIVMGFADSGAHINNMAFYNLAIRVLQYVKSSHTKGEPIMSYEKAIWRMTKENADFFNIDAGHLAIGKRADITIIDPEQLSDKVHEYHTAKFLSSCDRLVNDSSGVVEHVIINGKVALENGELTSEIGNVRFGQFLQANHEYPNQRIEFDFSGKEVEISELA